MKPISHPPIGKLIEIGGGSHLHLYAIGEGQPSVVFESGGGSWSMDWHLVQSEVAKFTCACAYDRAGFGWSDRGVKPRTSEQIVTELHSLLENSGLEKPYILVGASFGGHTVRLYAKRYPVEVAGLILLDARHEELNSRMPPTWRQQETAGKSMYSFQLLASRLGALALLGKLMGANVTPPITEKLPAGLKPIYLEVGYQPKYFESNLDELAACTKSDEQLSVTGPLGDIPLTVIRHGIPDLFARMPAEQAKQAEQIWQEMQTELANLSTNSRMLVAEQSGHGIQVDQPDLVVEAIREMVEMVRKELRPA